MKIRQEFNNELILLKKNVEKAKTHIIHKLTRKSNTYLEKKVPEVLQQKYARKAKIAIQEVKVLKKIKPKHIGRFALAHTEPLQHYLNRPEVNMDRACARLLLHKALSEKYKYIRDKFSHVPLDDLLMSRQERRRIKKEERKEKKAKDKAKRDKKDGKSLAVCTGGDWSVEESFSGLAINDCTKGSDAESDGDYAKIVSDLNGSLALSNHDENQNFDVIPKTPPIEPAKNKTVRQVGFDLPPKEPKTKKKPKNVNKEKVKTSYRKYKEEMRGPPITPAPVADPFFTTATGQTYMSVAEVRPPDEVKEEHRYGNRQLRRASKFGTVPKNRPRSNYKQDYGRSSQNGLQSNQNSHRAQLSRNKPNRDTDNASDFPKTAYPRGSFDSEARGAKRTHEDAVVPSKLHPSWEAKKKQSGIVPFQGKKILFDADH